MSQKRWINSIQCYVAEGFKLFCEREAPLEIRTHARNEATEAASVEAIHFRVLIRAAQSELEAVRVRHFRLWHHVTTMRHLPH